MNSYSPLELYIAIQLISYLLQAHGKLLVVWVTQLSSTQLCPGHCGSAVSMTLNPLIYETTGDKDR